MRRRARDVLERRERPRTQACTAEQGPPIRHSRPSSRPGRVHAESSATQRAFHYLLPLCWLAGAERAGAERVAEGTTAARRPGNSGVRRPAHAPRSDESSDVTRRASSTAQDRAARRCRNDGRVAQLRFDPELRGLLSPFAAATRTRLHRARAADTIVVGGELFVVVELRGRGFLPQQARRLMGVAVLMQRGELPADAFDVLTRRDVVLRNAPAAGARVLRGRALLGARGQGRRRVVRRRRRGRRVASRDLREDLVINANSDEWLRAFDSQALAAAVSAARRSGHDEAPASSEEVVVAATPPPPAYVSCLRELRAAHESGRWPRTSVARSKLIRPTETAASFTLERPPSQARGNAAFPKLAEAVFALESNSAGPAAVDALRRQSPRRVRAARRLGPGPRPVHVAHRGPRRLQRRRALRRRRRARRALRASAVRRLARAPLDAALRRRRYSLVWFTPAEAQERTSADARAAEVLGNRDFRYRENSSDALAILEVLGSECRCAAAVPGRARVRFRPARGRCPGRRRS